MKQIIRITSWLSVCGLLCWLSLVMAQPRSDDAQLADLVRRVQANVRQYRELCRDLIAEERRTIEIYDKTGQLKKERRILSELMLYQSAHDATDTIEFRNVREVDGKPVKNQDDRIADLFARLQKAESSDHEYTRLMRESTRYDLKYKLAEYTFQNALPTWKPFFPRFTFKLAGRQQVDGRDCLVLKFEQQEVHPDLWDPGGMIDRKTFTGAFMRGIFLVDEQTAQIRREHDEIFLRHKLSGESCKLAELDFDYQPSQFDILLPRRVVLQIFEVHKSGGPASVRTFRGQKIVTDLGEFRRFSAEGKQERIESSVP